MRWTLDQILQALPGARFVPAAGASADATAAARSLVITNISTDSRAVGPGEIFVALRGEVHDAHTFLPQVAERGASAVVVDTVPDGFALPAIVVPNTLTALGRIANAWRERFKLPLIGVTGSNGKTTVKEMIAAILAAAHGEEGRLATRGNLNNEIGVPLTLFRLDTQHRSAVVEMGMNHPGEIGRLSAIAAPTVGLVNNAQREHQEFMHTVEAVARENGSVISALSPDGVAVFPHSDEYTHIWRALAAGSRVLTFGLAPDAGVSASATPAPHGSDLAVTIREDGGSMIRPTPLVDAKSAVAPGVDAESAAPHADQHSVGRIIDPPCVRFNVRLNAFGDHNVLNALAAIACTHAAGIPAEQIKSGLESFAPVSGRLQKKQAANGATIIDDTYNANPDSVRAAIDVLAKAPAPRVLVLGDMGEVGTQGKEFHEEVAAYAGSKGLEHVLSTGALAAHMAPHARHYKEFEELLKAVEAAATPDATVLIKGSRFMKMERVVQHLIGSQQATKETH
jgi:UDP-N-acetylmuramoyl-tripeptide--D-alanyl-D-alanine ligase